MPIRFATALSHLAPALPRATVRELARAPVGAVLGVTLCGVLVLLSARVSGHPLHLVAPVGATAVLVFALPNSPLAQPWSAVVGNTVSALVAVAVVMTFPSAWAPGLAVGLAILAMMLARAMHPPGGAVALLAALDPAGTLQAGFSFAVMPVGLLTLALVMTGILFNRMSGRAYPLRLPADVPRTQLEQRLALSDEELAALLRRFNQSANIGIADLGRLLAAAEQEAAHHRFDAVTCGDLMTGRLIVVAPTRPLAEVGQMFRAHRIKSLPVVDSGGAFVGLILQADLIAALTAPGGTAAVIARDVMRPPGDTVAPELPVGALLGRLARQGTEVIPVARENRLVGIITRSDVLALLMKGADARRSEQAGGPVRIRT